MSGTSWAPALLAAGTPAGAATVSGTHSGNLLLVVTVFLACAVEMVEALTIVVAVGTTRGWRVALEGAVAATVALGALVAALGPAVIHLVPIDALRVLVGLLLLWFGFGWLRKAVLRASGRKAKHDEAAIYTETVAGLEREADAAAPSRRRDWAGFLVAFKGVFLEGFEVVIIVLTLGGASHQLGLATVAAGCALVLVGAVGAVAARPLSKVPENAMKMAVGLLLVSFGTFWIGEGLGLRWPGSDAALLVLLAAYGLLAFGAVVALSRASRPSKAESA